MADLKQVEAAFLKADAAGDTEAARVLAGEVRRLRAEAASQKSATSTPEPESSGVLGMVKDAASFVSPAGFAAELGRDPKRLGNFVAGGARGAGSIGATILLPFDKAANALGIENDIIGRKDRYSDMTNALQIAGADVNSGEFKAGKLGAEVAGTAGAGGLAANTVRAVAPSLAARAPALLTAIESGGMSAGQSAPGATGFLPNALARSAGGAISGGLSAGLVNPSEAASGAAVGAALPPALKAERGRIRRGCRGGSPSGVEGGGRGWIPGRARRVSTCGRSV